MIELDQIESALGGRRFLLRTTLHVQKGEHVVICGPSGAGKTTLLRVIAGLAPVSAGRVVIDGKLASDRTGEIARPYERKIGMVFQDLGLWPHLGVAQNVGLALRSSGWRNYFRRSGQIRKTLESVRLEGFGARRISSLSGGELQRVALARALVSQPLILLLDEPLTALDLALREELADLIAAQIRATGVTVVSVLHDPHDAVRLAPDRLVAMEGGAIAEEIAGSALRHATARSATLQAWQRRLNGV